MAAGRESQGSCDEDPRPARSAEGRSRKPWACMLVRAWKHGAGSEGEGGRHGLHKRDDACGMVLVETSAGAEVVKCDQEARQNLFLCDVG